MAEFKTAEQYVVDRLETTERELEDLKIEYGQEMAKAEKAYKSMCEKYHDAVQILNDLRDFLDVRYDSYFGNCVHLEIIHGKEHPELVARLVEYFDMQTEEDNE